MSYKLFSVDDHLLEPPDLWTSRMPSKHREDCMRLVRHDGVDVWSYEGRRAGTFKDVRDRRPPTRPVGHGHDQLRRNAPGVLRPEGALRGAAHGRIVGSVAFPTASGSLDARSSRPKKGPLASLHVQAYNDFMLDEWCAADPAILVPTILCQLGMPSWLPRRSAVALRAALAR